jgi:hypothetical protein
MPAIKYDPSLTEPPPPEHLLVPNVDKSNVLDLQYRSTFLCLRTQIYSRSQRGYFLTWYGLQLALRDAKNRNPEPGGVWFDDPSGTEGPGRLAVLFIDDRSVGYGSLNYCRAWTALREQRFVDVSEDWIASDADNLVYEPQYPPVGTVRIYRGYRPGELRR